MPRVTFAGGICEQRHDGWRMPVPPRAAVESVPGTVLCKWNLVAVRQVNPDVLLAQEMALIA